VFGRSELQTSAGRPYCLLVFDLGLDLNDVAQGRVLLCEAGGWVGVDSHQANESPEADDGCPERPREIRDPASDKPAAEEQELDDPEKRAGQPDKQCEYEAHASLLWVVVDME